MIKQVVFTASFLTLVSPAYAASSANVTVNNNVTSNSNSNTTSHTSITVETNGKTIKYESDKPGSVKVESINGESSIKVDGQEVTPNSVNNDKSASPSPTMKINKVINNEEKNESGDKEIMELKKNEFIQKLILRFPFLKKFLFWQH